MKKTIQSILILALLFACPILRAQMIGIESPVQEKNIMIGFKAGVNAMDMAYAITNTNEDLGTTSFTNYSALYKGKWLSSLAGGISVERTLHQGSYGLEFMVTSLNALNTSDEYHFATQDSAFYLNARIPIRAYILRNKKATPYVMVAPELSTYVTADTIALINNAVNGYSVWNGHNINWGTKYANTFNFNILVGAGVNYKINLADYQIIARFEAAYKLGLLNTLPKTIDIAPDMEIKRMMRGWEATIGLSFPLIKNPSYQWMM